MTRLCTRTAMVLAVLLSTAAVPALAQTSTTPPTPLPPRSSPVVQTPLPEPSFIEEHADSFFAALRDGVRWIFSSAGEMVTPPMAVDVARRAKQSDPYDFVAMMETAGYKLKEVESSVALIPTIGFTFAIARELSDADREWLAIQLDRHARRRSGLWASAERTIVQTLLDAQELGGYRVEKLVVDVFPWPQVKFFIAPTDAPVSEETSLLMRAIERGANQTVKTEMQTVPKPNDGSTPAAAPRVGVQSAPVPTR